ncbi:ATPase, P-type (transporting), HAD superfamily, subfamily IC [Marssonina coronariae]|uniref:ATPase, P-type (Transporting), HAD superfamily, subfamily IC n=1 Tax=Diplocarpon coronariae TaxID=2795749 RepID=A0A218ZB57_9HELO|nr:hypothetical protein JHW43_005188 [Diplocarpon mali]OWP05267.1 ATPase, P-type (transporting), HAD superfamily, subfamily IC [Marssonina coronariae]
MAAAGWLGSGETTHMSVAAVSNIFTTLFLVLNFSIAFVGHRLIKRQGHRNILKSKAVPVTHFTPWLSLGSAFTYIWTLRRIPGGYLGLIMIASGLFGTGNRYIINSCIVPDMAQGVCDFTSGLVATQNSFPIQPVSTWSGSYLALQSFEIARINNAEIGIYSKLNNDLTGFYPTINDLVGNWSCEPAADTAIEPEEWAPKLLEDFLGRQEFLRVTRGSYWRGEYTPSNGYFSGFMAWGPSGDPQSNTTNVRAMISNPASTNGRVLETAAVVNIECKQISLSNWIAASWPAGNATGNSTIFDTYAEWAAPMFGFVKDKPRTEYPLQLTKVLNAMSMLSGSGNHDDHVADVAKSYNAGATYGCLLESTRIYNTVYIVTLVLFIILAAMIVVDVYDLVRTKLDKRHKEVERMPFDMLEWQVALVERMTGNSITSERQLAGYEYVWDGSAGRSYCRKIGEQHGSIYEPVGNPGGNDSDQSATKSSVVLTSTKR